MPAPTGASWHRQIEGAEYEALRNFDFGKYRFQVLTVERPVAALRQLLRNNSYVFMVDNGCFGDQLWVHNSLAPKAAKLLGLKVVPDPSLDVNTCCAAGSVGFVEGATIDNGCCGTMSTDQKQCVAQLAAGTR